MVTLGSFLLLAVLIGLGWMRGVLRMGAAFAALVVASLLASPLQGLTAWAVSLLGSPKLLVPMLSTLATGLLLFGIFLVPAMLWVKRRYGDARPSWDAPLGALMGGVWGLTLVLLTLTGLTSVARLDRVMRSANAEAAVRMAARQRFERQARDELRPLATTMTRKRMEEEIRSYVAEQEKTFVVDPAELRKATEHGALDTFLVDLEHSPFEGVVDSVTPVNAGVEETLRDLTIVVGDPVLLERFRSHPAVEELARDPRISSLATDIEIAGKVMAGNYRELMDHPKILQAVRSDEVRAKFTRADIPKVLRQVRGR